MTPSIKEVAKRAGVSAGTVSRAFNDYPDIKPETRERILEIAKELGYSPTLSAKNLSSKKSTGMAFLVFREIGNLNQKDEDGNIPVQDMVEDSVFPIMCGASQYAIETGLDIPVYIYSSQMQERKTYEQFCREHRLGGAMIFGLKTIDPYYQALKHSELPCVTVDTRVIGANVGFVGTDNIRSFRELTQYLLDRGHRKIIFLNGRRVATVCLERLAGAYEAFQANGLELKREDVLYTNFDEKITSEIVTRYISQHGTEGATAFLCASDTIGVSAVQAILRMGYRVPEDFSVVGYDGMSSARLTTPALTTIDQRLEAKGYAGARLLHTMMNGECSAHEVLMPYELVERASVAEPR